MNLQRRITLCQIGRSAALVAAAGAGVLAPLRSAVARNAAAFDARDPQHALAALGIERPEPSTAIRVGVPDVADSGAYVPLEAASMIAGTESLIVLADRNPWPCIARFEFAGGALPFVAFRFRLNENSPVRVVARADRRDHVVTKQVSVVEAGCLDDTPDDAPAALDRGVAARAMQIRATSDGGSTEVRVLLAHPMENGLRRNASGQLFPEHFVRHLKLHVQGRVLVAAELGRSVAANPLFAFRLRDARVGDPVLLRWEDSAGLARSDEAIVGGV